ncbi:hypothetical protein GSF27_05660 [Pseudomaricurvus sp. HS19]|nr:hypothetical protein [Pseudomaricurvus sp. HS19]MYM62839.1 hypothetical protein [Pseudomaricurvus sp. HS19]
MTATAGAGPNELVLQFPGGGAVLLCQKPVDTDNTLPSRYGTSRLTILVPDLKALEKQLTASGYPLPEPIKVLPQYKVAITHITDPDGNQLELYRGVKSGSKR